MLHLRAKKARFNDNLIEQSQYIPLFLWDLLPRPSFDPWDLDLLIPITWQAVPWMPAMKIMTVCLTLVQVLKAMWKVNLMAQTYSSLDSLSTDDRETGSNTDSSETSATSSSDITESESSKSRLPKPPRCISTLCAHTATSTESMPLPQKIGWQFCVCV